MAFTGCFNLNWREVNCSFLIGMLVMPIPKYLELAEALSSAPHFRDQTPGQGPPGETSASNPDL